MARRVAVDSLAKYGAKEVHTKLAYAIGVAEPVMAVAVVDGKEVPIEGYDLTPAGIREFLGLDAVRFAGTAEWGHFGRGFPWDGAAD
jgi:S-adenosylmethionine synthetase